MPEPRPHPRQRAAPYLEALQSFAARGPRRAMVPGHKGGGAADGGLRDALSEGAMALDLPTLIEGVDVAARGEIAPYELARRLAADAWGARRTWFLTNGASQGNVAACLAIAQRGERVVVQRTVHGSTIDGLVLAGLEPAFVAPEVDVELGLAHCVLPSALDAALARAPEAAAAIVVSPTYYGAAADVAGLARVAHAHGVPLVVDEAWGAHLAFCDALPQHALAAGADLVISSTHKHAGSLTQSAMLHLGAGGHFDEAAIDRALGLVTSTSPSSLLLASLDAARRHAAIEGEPFSGGPSPSSRCCAPRSAESPGSRSSTSAWWGASASPPSTRCGCASTYARPGSVATRWRAGCAAAATSTWSCAARTSSSPCSGSASASRSTARLSSRRSPQPAGRTSVLPPPEG